MNRTLQTLLQITPKTTMINSGQVALQFYYSGMAIIRLNPVNPNTDNHISCHFPDKEHISQFLICTECHQIAELEDANVNKAITRQAARSGFKVAQQTVEIKGLCPICQPL